MIVYKLRRVDDLNMKVEAKDEAARNSLQVGPAFHLTYYNACLVSLSSGVKLKRYFLTIRRSNYLTTWPRLK